MLMSLGKQFVWIIFEGVDIRLLSILFKMFLKLFLSIQDNLIALAQEKIGSPMLYDLIEVCMVLLPNL
jgi:hypothetical protein